MVAVCHHYWTFYCFINCVGSRFEIPKTYDYIITLLLWGGMFIYSYGVLVFLNNYYDGESIQTYTPIVISKRAAGGDDGTRYITVTPWYNFEKPFEIEVKSSFYKEVNKNDLVLIGLKKGYLGLEWYEVSPLL